jgi:hypothetical protein
MRLRTSGLEYTFAGGAKRRRFGLSCSLPFFLFGREVLAKRRSFPSNSSIRFLSKLLPPTEVSSREETRGFLLSLSLAFVLLGSGSHGGLKHDSPPPVAMVLSDDMSGSCVELGTGNEESFS